jgi:hypothetical protein
MGVGFLNTIDKLEKAKYDINFSIDKHNEFGVDVLYKPDIKNFIDVRIMIKRLAKDRNIKVPSFIKECRTIDEAVTNLMFESNIDEITLKNYVNSVFNEYIDYLEDELIDVQIVHVQCQVPRDLTFGHIIDSINNCESRIDTGDYSGAVTSAKTLVEGVCKEILVKFSDSNVDNKTDLPALFTKVRRKLNLDPRDPNLDKALKEVLSGLIKIVNGIAEIRNTHGDSHIPKYKIDKHHALIVVNSAKTVVTFLFNTYEYQFEKGTLILG